MKASNLESKLIPTNRWDEAPKSARLLAEEESAHGVPTGIAFDPEHGWFVIQSSGQGPYIIWSEREAHG